MAEVNGKNVEQVVADALREALHEDGFVATTTTREGYTYSFVALREEEDPDTGKLVTLGVKVMVQDVVPVWPPAGEPF